MRSAVLQIATSSSAKAPPNGIILAGKLSISLDQEIGRGPWKGAWVMPKKRFSSEQIVTQLRQIEVSMAQGNPTPVACRDAGISLQSSGTNCSTERSSTV